MKMGLLWYDDNPERGLAEKIGGAAERYRRKFGVSPDTCCVHPSALSGAEAKIGEIRVVSQPSVLRYHFWIGRGDKGTSRRG